MARTGRPVKRPLDISRPYARLCLGWGAHDSEKHREAHSRSAALAYKERVAYDLIRVAGHLIRGANDLIRVAGHLIRGASDLIRVADHLIRGLSDLIRVADHLIHGLSDLIRVADDLTRGAAATLLERGRPMPATGYGTKSGDTIIPRTRPTPEPRGTIGCRSCLAAVSRASRAARLRQIRGGSYRSPTRAGICIEDRSRIRALRCE